ncbi:hypothetical protein ABPG74_005191 [Tetrahymena malaccensis]
MLSAKVKGCDKKIVKRTVQSGFCIAGDWIIEFDEQKYHSTCLENRMISFKEFHKQLQIMEVNLQRKKPIEKNLNIFLDILGNSDNESHRNLHQIFVRYQSILQQYSLIFKQIKFLLQNPVSEAIINKDLSDLRQNFNNQIKLVMEKQLAGVEFFFYSITSNNYQSEVQEKTKMGYSNKLMMLLARSVENFEHIYLKERSCEIFDQQSMLDIFSCQILEQSQTKCSLTTLDNIKLTLDVKICIYCHDSNDTFAQKYNLLKGFFKDSVICIYYPKVEQHHLDLLYKVRKEQKKNSQNNWESSSSIQDEDSYSQNEIISKFYSSDNQKLEEEDQLEKMKKTILQKQRRNLGNGVGKDASEQICDKLSSFNLK